MEIEVVDSYPKRGRRGCDFHYVREGNLLYHISRYSVSESKVDRDTFYRVPLEAIKGKWVYIFGRTNSGFPVF